MMKRLFARLALLLTTLLVVAAMGEAVARFLAPRPRSRPEPAQVEPQFSGLPVLTGMRDIAKANVEGVFGGVYFRTNDYGLRGPPISPRAERGTFRILVSGDSVTMGWGVEEEDAYPRVLERLLNDAAAALPGGHPRYEVINAGLAGINSRMANHRIIKFGDKLRPDLTIYGFTVNDIEGPQFRRSPRPVPKEETVEAWRNALRFRESPSYLLRAVWPRLMLVVDRDSLMGGLGGDPESLDWYRNYFENPPAWSEFADGLGRHAFYAASEGICGAVLLATHLSDLSPSHRFLPIYQRVAKAAEGRGLHVVRTFDAFEGRDPLPLQVNPFDSHPNWEGQVILAQALFDGLRELPAECWRTASQREQAVSSQ